MEKKMNSKEMQEIFEAENYICFTSDLDWAPEAAIDDTLNMYKKNKIKPTIFVTHPSQVIERHKDTIDIGIHPNFIQPSSQGNNLEEIIQYCQSLAGNTQVFRCHRWYSSNDVYDILANQGYKYESNLCTDMDIVPPFMHRSGLISFPVFMEDGAFIIKHNDMQFKDVKNVFRKKGLKVINIHPMHYALNTPYFRYTREIKDKLAREEWNGMGEELLRELSYKGRGISNFIDELIDFSQTEDMKIITLEQAYHLVC